MNRSQFVFRILGKKFGFDLKELVCFVNESQYWSKREIKEYQTEKLSIIIKHAYETVPFYKNLFNGLGLKPGDIESENDLKKLPIITKDIVRRNFNDFLSKDFNQFNPMKRATGGTTGVAFPFYNDAKSWAMAWAVKIRAFEWAGYHIGDDGIGILAGGSLVPKERLSLRNVLWRYLQNYYSLPISNLTQEKMSEFLQLMKKRRIEFLRGYPTSIYTYAKFLYEDGIELPLKAVITTAEMLHDHQRELFNSVFKCDTFDHYGCGDGMGAALECEKHNGLHITSETSVMQIVDRTGEEVHHGELGEVVLTSLHDFAMPLIRYAPGDQAVKKATRCACGRTLPMLERIEGRTSDLIEFSNGVRLNGLSIPFEVWGDKIEKFQIIQTERDAVEVLFEARDSFNKSDLKRAHDVMSYHCGEGVDIKIKLVDEIPLPESGKLRYVISKVTEQKIN